MTKVVKFSLIMRNFVTNLISGNKVANDKETIEDCYKKLACQKPFGFRNEFNSPGDGEPNAIVTSKDVHLESPSAHQISSSM